MRRLFSASPLSLIATARAFVVVAFAFAALAGILSTNILQKIEADAAHIQEQQIPAVLNQNRNALKVEKLASLVRSAYLAKDSAIERQIQLQTRLLAQSFALDGDNILTQGAAQMAEGVRKIIAARVAERAMAQGATDTQSPSTQIKLQVDQAEALDIYTRTMKLADGLTANLSTGAALVADKISVDIQQTAVSIRQAWLYILGVPVIATVLLFWFFTTHIVRPINVTVRRLAAIGQRRALPDDKRSPLFSDMAMIREAVDTFARVSEELHQKNELLMVLSDQDPLTNVGNRRHFDISLQAQFEAAKTGDTNMALLLIDLDHFKQINDLHGHPAGDACLRYVGALLSSFCDMAEYQVARYGGEEFVVIMPASDTATAVIFAEKLRVAIEASPVAMDKGIPPIRITASIGVATLLDLDDRTPEALIETADAALYRAKRDGRNVVCSYEVGQRNLSARSVG